MNPFELNQHFFSLVSMFASACWQQLGKTPNPTDGETVVDLEGAQTTIDMLLMLQNKTKGNLTETEAKLLADTIASLQANYAQTVGNDAR